MRGYTPVLYSVFFAPPVAAVLQDLLKDLSAGFPSLCDLSTLWRSGVRALTDLRQIWFAVLWTTVEAGSFLLTVFNDFGTDEWRKMLRSQHTFDQLLGKPIILMTSLQNRPRGATWDPKCLGLFVKRKESGGNQCLADFPDFHRLSCLHLCDQSWTDLTVQTLQTRE